MQNDSIITTLNQSLQSTRSQKSKLENRLNEIESEADGLRQEIEALDQIERQTEEAIWSLLSAQRPARKQTSVSRYSNYDEEEDYSPLKRPPQYQPNVPPRYQPLNNVVPVNRHQPRDDFRQPKHQAQSDRFADRTITQACSILFKEASKPLHVNELYQRLLDGGFQFTGNNPTISIAVSLNRNRRFRKVAPGTFDLVFREAAAS